MGEGLTQNYTKHDSITASEIKLKNNFIYYFFQPEFIIIIWVIIIIIASFVLEMLRLWE